MLDQCQQKLEKVYGNLERMQSDIESLKGNSETETERAVFGSANFKSKFDIKQRKCLLEPSTDLRNSPTINNIQSILPEIKIKPLRL